MCVGKCENGGICKSSNLWVLMSKTKRTNSTKSCLYCSEITGQIESILPACSVAPGHVKFGSNGQLVRA